MTDQLPAYLIVQLDVKDLGKHFSDYGMPLVSILESYGAEVLAATPEPTILEGSYAHNLTAIIKFASVEVAERFYHSPEYQPLKAKRLENTNAATSRLAIAPSFRGL